MIHSTVTGNSHYYLFGVRWVTALNSINCTCDSAENLFLLSTPMPSSFLFALQYSLHKEHFISVLAAQLKKGREKFTAIIREDAEAWQHTLASPVCVHRNIPTLCTYPWTVCTQRERDNSWSIATYNKIIIIIAWLWVSLLAPILYIYCSWNMSGHPELTPLQTALKIQLIFLNLWAAPLFSLQDTAHNFAAAIYLWLHREVGSRLPCLLLLLLLP